jgi:hypothetical protein
MYVLPNRAHSDERSATSNTVPVCRTHHRELHRYGDEASWWSGVGVDPVDVALRLWRRTHTERL